MVEVPPARHIEYSCLFSADDEPWPPSRRLFEITSKIAAICPYIHHNLLSQRTGDGNKWFNVFPGEHYNFLTAITKICKPRVIWEFGTNTGMGTVALLEGAEENTKIITVDIDPWHSKERSWIQEEDIKSGKISQLVLSMSDPSLFIDKNEELAEADLIFVDGPKDVDTETAFFEHLDKMTFRRNPIVVVDDIRLLKMLRIWRNLEKPKFDLTSFGHWSGTGLVDWCS
jgi:predicted O-methyltransferase YrrM